jgi:hypothetical protein
MKIHSKIPVDAPIVTSNKEDTKIVYLCLNTYKLPIFVSFKCISTYIFIYK